MTGDRDLLYESQGRHSPLSDSDHSTVADLGSSQGCFPDRLQDYRQAMNARAGFSADLNYTSQPELCRLECHTSVFVNLGALRPI